MTDKKLRNDHSITYRSNRFIHATHRQRLKECKAFLLTHLQETEKYGTVFDLGGASGFLADELNRCQVTYFSEQIIFDLEHPKNNTNKKWYEPKLNPIYVTTDLNQEICFESYKKPNLIIISETLEHVAEPIETLNAVYKASDGNTPPCYISFPRETGTVGFAKFLLRILTGRNIKKGLQYNFQYLTWILLRKRYQLRDKRAFYADHDGFDDQDLVDKINKNFKYYEIAILYGASTVHILLKPNPLNF
jgi:hypothetical protein